MDYSDKIKVMAREIIENALHELRSYRRKRHINNSAQQTAFRGFESTLAWFNARSDVTFGYGWCLHYSQINPNVIRSAINKYTTEQEDNNDDNDTGIEE